MGSEKKYILIVGMGKVGNAVAAYLIKQGKDIVITDGDISKKQDAEIFEKQGIKTEIGFHNENTFKNAGKIIVSPGVPLDIPGLVTARRHGVPVSGELDIIADRIDVPLVAVTGTNGKTTTTALLGKMLEESGLNVFVCGNIGTPIVEYITRADDTGARADIIVAEISSFQLDTSDNFRPDIAVLLNIAQDHLDRYSDYQEYARSKWSIFKNQTKDQTAIINAEIEDVNLETAKITPKIIYFNNGRPLTINKQHIDPGRAQLKGTHNNENIAAAALAAYAAGATVKGVLKGLETFTPMPHRLEFVKSIKKIDFYNDSKATNPDAVKRAVQCFDNNILLIMGGQEKDTDFTCLKESFKTKVKKLIVMGEAGDKITQTFSDVCDVCRAVSMEDAVRLAAEYAHGGDTVLLAPGCASFDMYKDYSERGFDFINQVKGLEN